MSFALLTDEGHLAWEDGKLSGTPPWAVSEAEDAMREREWMGATPTGPWFERGTPEHAWLVLRSLAPRAEVGGDPPQFGSYGDELPTEQELQEGTYVEALHPRDRLGRWRDVLRMPKPHFSGTILPGIRYRESKGNEASNVVGRVEVGPKFFDLKPEQRENVLAHEIGHDYDHELLTSDETAWVWDEKNWLDANGVPLNGPGAGAAERIADAIAAALLDDQEAIDRWPAIARISDWLDRKHGVGAGKPEAPEAQKVESRVAQTYAEAAQMVADGMARKLDREWAHEREKIREWLLTPHTGEYSADNRHVAALNIYKIQDEAGGGWGAVSYLLDTDDPDRTARSHSRTVEGHDPDEFLAALDAMVEKHKTTRLAQTRKNLRGIVQKKAGEGKLAYDAASEAIQENNDMPEYVALRERWGIPDDIVLISEAGYGKPFSGIKDVMVTASRDVRSSYHTAVNALALIVDQRWKVKEREGNLPPSQFTRETMLKPGVDFATTKSNSALLRHEWAHSLWEEMSDAQQQEFVDLLPDTWEGIAAGLSQYAAGDEESRRKYDANNERPVPRYYTETFAEAVALTTGTDYDSEKWPTWVQSLADYIKELKRE